MSGDRASKGKAALKTTTTAGDWDAARDLRTGWQGTQDWESYAELVKNWQGNENNDEFANGEDDMLSSHEMYWLRDAELKEIEHRLKAQGVTPKQASLAVTIIKEVGLAAAEHLAETSKLPRRKRGALSDQELEDMAAMRNVPPGLDAVEVARMAKSAKEALRWRRKRSPKADPRNG